jgi:hypothetical protein
MVGTSIVAFVIGGSVGFLAGVFRRELFRKEP